tara:strand:+ start:21953 stop:22876 length:924 start_codon:yes stop_codon:yes gene_type:complete
MATNLRDLLGFVSTESIKALAVSDTHTKVPPFPSKGYCVQYIATNCGANCDNRELNDINYYSYTDWTVPADVDEIIFEAWGGGGGGGSGCCCSYGIPGSSGAYAYKKLHGVEVVEGCSYEIAIGPGGCGFSGPQCGDQGCTTYITGFSLTNFCAEGGFGGCSCCNMCCCSWKVIDPSGSGTCPGGPCALYYGADGGYHGNAGAGYLFCHDNRCFNKQHLPYPGGLVNGKGGWLPTTQCESSGCGYCMMHWGQSQLQWGGNYSDNNYIPGVGGASAWTCGGGCCRATNGLPGLVRISYRYKGACYGNA